MGSRGAPPLGGDIDYGWKLEVGATVAFVLAAVVTGLRCVARIKYSKWGWDDTSMVVAVILGLTATILDYVAVNYGFGRHSYYLTAQNTVHLQYRAIMSQVFCVMAITFAKISIVLTYLRILRGSGNRIQQASLCAVAILNLLVNITAAASYYVSCDPTTKAWDSRVAGTCWSAHAKSGLVLLSGAFSAFSDFFLALFPFFMLKKLNVSKQTKAVILCLMGLGMVTGVFAVVRTTQFGISLVKPTNGPPDTTFSNVNSLLWGGMERNIAIMIGNAPCLRPYVVPLKKLYSDTFGTSSKKSSLATPVNDYQLSDRRKFNELSRGYDAKSESQGSMKQSSSVVITTEEQTHPASVV